MKRWKSYLKYSVYTLGVLLLILLASILAMNYTFQVYKKDVIQATTLQIEYFKRDFDEELLRLRNTARDMFTDSAIGKENAEAEGEDTMKVIQKLNLYKSSLPMVNDVFICFSMDKLYTDKGSCRLTTYSDERLKLTDESAETLTNAIRNRASDERLLLTSETGKKGLMYVFSSPESKYFKPMKVCFYISDLLLSEKIYSVFSIYDSAAVLFLDSGEIIAQTSNYPLSEQGKAFETYEWISKGKEPEALGLTLIQSDSVEMGYSLYLAIDSKQIWSQQQSLKQFFTYISIFLFIIVVILIFIINYRFYSPVIKLTHYVIQQNGTDTIQNAENEYAIIQGALEQNIKITQDQKQRMQLMRRRNITFALNSGIIHSEKDLASLLHEYDYEPTGDYCCVVGSIVDSSAEQLCQSVSNTAEFELCAPVILGDREALCAILFFSNADEAGRERMDSGKRFLECIERANAHGIAICFGMVYGKLSSICLSYKEMCSVLDYSLKLQEESGEGETTVIFFEKLAKVNRYSYHFSPEMMQQLQSSIRERNTLQAQLCISRLMDIYTALPNNEDNRRFHRYAIIQAINSVVLEEPNAELLSKKLLQILSVEDTSFCRRITEFMKLILVQPSENTEVFSNKLLKYIQEHCLDFNLKVDNVAEYFDVSRQTINSVTKSAVGMTYSEYVTKLRFEQACILLSTTDFDIQDVAQKVGYIDSRNFIRKFKTMYGVTPGNYRNQKEEMNES